jgi:flagella basal body P-ring formation protein FlgA
MMMEKAKGGNSFLISTFALVSALAATAFCIPAPVSIRFRDASTVEGEVIRLGDIARIMAGEERAVAQLETLQVAKAAAFGLTRSVDTEILYARYLQPLSDRYLIDYDRKNIRVSTRAQILSADSLASLIDGFLKAQAKGPRETWRWEILRSPGDVLVPTTPHKVEIAYSGVRRKGRLDLSLIIKSALPKDMGRALRTLPVAINLRVEEPVLVAKTLIQRDSLLDASTVSLEMRETTLFNEMAIGEPEKLLGRIAKVTIVQGRVITPRLVSMPPAVRRGQEAKIIFKNGAVSITADAVCRQDGIPGQIITAVSQVTHRLVRVRVTEDGVLEPVPGG